MTETYSVSEARSHLSELLKRLQQDPETTIEITVNGIPMGELRAPERHRLRIQPGTALSDALEAMTEGPNGPDGDDGPHSVARDHDRHLYTRDADPSSSEA